MSLLYPATSLRQYKIENKELIVIGEIHIDLLKNHGVDIVNTWDFITDKVKNNYMLHLELEPNFMNNINWVIKNIASVNIRKTLQNLKKINMLDKVSGMDVRKRSDFFGMFNNPNIQAYFFNKSEELAEVNIWQFLAVIDNMMIFTNRHFYNSKLTKLINHINPKILENLFNLHKIADKHSKTLKHIIRKDAKNKQGIIYNFKDVIPLLNRIKYHKNIGNIVDDYRDFVLFFSDLLILIEILHNENNKKIQKHILLIGEAHAKNFDNFLKKYITYPFKHPKMSLKEKKMAGNEVKKNTVYIKFLK